VTVFVAARYAADDMAVIGINGDSMALDLRPGFTIKAKIPFDYSAVKNCNRCEGTIMAGVTANSCDDVCHGACAPNEVETFARDVVAGLLQDYDLVRACEKESSGQKPDFRSPRHAVEVKELASRHFAHTS
jgi:hypothetical protein